ncbi:Immunoglobulin-like and fibronectin type III domain-containing protein 1, partial [Ophiophagus hannah]
MANWRGVKSLNKSALPGVAITQFVEDIPKGYSLPDFERKPITVTLQEGKNAIFRAVVKGEPKPKILWKCSNREMDDSQKYQISFNPDTNEFILQINKITSDDADLYHCIAVNEYGEATCTAGLKIIEDLKKEIQDFRKTLKKRTPSAVPKKKMDMEQITQILLNAEKKDYEKICIKYGVVDFRGMLRKLQEMKKAREDKQAQYVYSIANLKHLKVNKEQRNASFDLEMELKHPESRICLYKDGQKINFGVNDDNLKHRLQQEGKNYNFTINDLQPDDAGIYQVKVEDVDIFSTELEAEMCLLRSLVTHLESNYNYDISILNDGPIYHLGIKNIQSSDKETYTIDTGSCSSTSKEKRKQSEEDSSDKAGQWSKPLDEEHAKKRHQGERQKDQDLLADFSMGKDAQYGNGQDSNMQFYNNLEKDGSLRSDGKIGFDQNVVLDGNIRRIGSLTDKTSQYGKNAMLAFNTGCEGTNGWQSSEGQVSTLNGADLSDRFNRESVLGFQDSILGAAEINRNQYIVRYNGGSGVGFDIAGKIEGLYGKEVTLGDSDQSGVRFDRNGSLCTKDGGLSGADMLYFKDNKLSEVGERSRLYRDVYITAESDVTEGDIGVAGKFYDKDNHLEKAKGLRLDGTKSSCGNMAGGIGDGGIMNEIYVNDVVLAESEVVPRFPSAGGIVVHCGTKGMSPESGTDRHNDAERLRVLNSKDSTIVDAGACISGKKDVLKGAVRPDGSVNIDIHMDVVLQGMSACNLANNIDRLYNKNDILRGTGAIGQNRATSISSLYCKHSTLDGAVVGGPYTIRNINEHHGKEVEINGSDAGSIGGLYDWKLGNYGKLGRTETTSGHCGKDGMLGETDANIASGIGGIDTLYGKGVLLDEIGASEYGNTVNITGLNDKNGIPNKASSCGADSSSGHDMLYGKDTGRFYGKDIIQNEADTTGLSGQSIMPCGFYSDGGGVRKIDGLYVKGDILGKVGASGGIFDKNSMIIGTVDDELSNGERLASKANIIGETARIYDKNGMSDGFITGLGAVSIEKNGPVHKLIIDKVEDSHAGKYKFEAEGICTEASIFVEDPPNVDSTLLEKLKKEPIVVKAGKNAMVKIPFEGQKPIRVMWLKDNQELLDDDRINIDSSENLTRLSIPSTSRNDNGDYKVRLKNECGSFEVPLKLEVIDKPQSPTGPIAVIDSSANGITIQWKPPRDDGGKPIQSYIIERQQVGRKTWVTQGKTSGSSTIFTTNKVEHDTSYYFRVKAVNSLGTSEALESDEVMAAAKASPSPPAPPKVNSANKDAITISWSAPHKIGNSRILGYRVEKRKKGSNFWTSVTDLPITDRKYTVNDLKEGLQYEFRVAAINNSGVGEASAPSEAIYARDPMKSPGPVKDLKVVNTDYCSISLSWMKPESAEESYVKGYIVEIRHSDTLKWTQCNTVPIKTTAYTFRGLKAREPYFVRVRAISDGGLGDPVEVDTCVQAVPSSVNPKFLVKDIVESFMNVKAGDAIHVRIPFEASPSSEVIWLKDGLPLPVKATTSIRERLSQLIIPEADLSDSGHYAISLQTEHGRKETFSFRVQVQDIPESPGPIQLTEKVPGTVTLIWEPSPTEKRDSNITYMVMRCDSRKGPWQMVADHIYTNKCTVVNFISGREYFFRVLAKNCVGISKPSETVNPWTIQKEKDKPEMKLPRYKGINRDQAPRFLVQLKPHVVNLGFNCHMSCAVTGDPAPQVTWYKGNKNLSQDPAFFCKNDFGVCSLVIPGVTPSDAGQYKVLAVNELGQAISKAELT